MIVNIVGAISEGSAVAFFVFVSAPGKDGEVGLGGSIFGFGERGWWGEFRFSGREAEVLEEAEILVGNVDITVRLGSTGWMIGKKKIADWA